MTHVPEVNSSKRAYNLFVNGALFLAALLLCLASLEAYTRLSFFGPRGVLFFWRYEPRLLGSSQFVVPSQNPLIRWELRPGERGYLNGVSIKINSAGMRDREYALEKPADTYRIAVTGDSFTFGVGVPFEDTYPKLLEGRLNESRKGPVRYEVMNFACGGYGTVDEVEVLKEKALPFAPDLIVLGFNITDLYGNVDVLKGKWAKGPQPLPEGSLKRIKQKIYYSLINQSFFVRSLQQRKLRQKNPKPWENSTLAQRLNASPGAWGIFEAQLDRLKELTEPRGVPVLFLIIHDLEFLDERYPFLEIHQRVAGIASSRGFWVLDFFPHFKGLEDDKLWIYPTDHHPNGRANRVYADAIFEKLTEEILPSEGITGGKAGA